MHTFEFDAETEIQCDLFTDFKSNEFEHLFDPNRQGNIGVTYAESDIIAEINNALTKKDIRPKAYDKISGAKILIDSGACISVWPRARFKNAPCDPSRNLVAVNGTQIKTYGSKVIKIQLANVTFNHKFVLSDISSPVLGFDFMVDNRLDLMWKKGKPTLKVGRTTIPLSMGRCDSKNLNLAPISDTDNFQKWALNHNLTNARCAGDTNSL